MVPSPGLHNLFDSWANSFHKKPVWAGNPEKLLISSFFVATRLPFFVSQRATTNKNGNHQSSSVTPVAPPSVAPLDLASLQRLDSQELLMNDESVFQSLPNIDDLLRKSSPTSADAAQMDRLFLSQMKQELWKQQEDRHQKNNNNMKWKDKVDTTTGLVGLITTIVLVSIYVSSIKARADGNLFRIEELEETNIRHDVEFDEVRKTVIETNTTVKNIEKYLIENN